jgi:hypothetical protein
MSSGRDLEGGGRRRRWRDDDDDRIVVDDTGGGGGKEHSERRGDKVQEDRCGDGDREITGIVWVFFNHFFFSLSQFCPI